MTTAVKDYPKKIKSLIKKRAGEDYDKNKGLMSQFIFEHQPEGFVFWYDVLKEYETEKVEGMFLTFDALDDIEVYEPEIVDPIVEKVIDSFRERSNVGIKKYGVTLSREDLSPLEWINHFQQELQDAILYAEKLKEYFKYNEKRNK